MKNWLNKYTFTITIVTGISIALLIAWIPVPMHFDSNNSIYRTVRAYKHLPNGNTEIYYKDGGLEIEGEWYFNLDSNYEFYREENSTIWKVDPF